MTKTILTIGAYERDNFGDALFFVVLNHIARTRGVQLIPGSIMSADMREYFGEYVLPYDFLLSRYTFDAVWVVGGEIGICNISMAFPMSLQRDYFSKYNALSPEMKRVYDVFLSGINSDRLAYLPTIKNYIKNIETPLVINSVGGFEYLESFHEDTFRELVLDDLRSAKVVSVRNQESHAYLTSQGVSSTLIPDSVHAISLIYQPIKIYEHPYIVFQLSEYLCTTYGLEVVEKNIIDLVQTYRMKVYLFAAGTAKHHDSVSLYRRIQLHIQQKIGGEYVEIVDEKDSLRRVSVIAGAYLYIGSSLHGRIVAMSYNIPRVSFHFQKVADYAKLWDAKFPYNATPDTLIDDCAKVISLGRFSSHDDSLAKKALENINYIFDTIYAK